MTILTVVQSVAMRVVGTTPNAVFSSTEQVVREIADLANDVAIDIARSHEWRRLIEIATMVGGDSFPVPGDYDRMLIGQGIQEGYEPFGSVGDYVAAVNGGLSLHDPGGWIIIGDEFKFYPAIASARFPYISSHIVRADDGTRKTAFDRDDDSFVLDERLLMLGLLWRYRAQEGLDYSEDMTNFELALAKAQNSDRGARMLAPDVRRRHGQINRPC